MYVSEFMLAYETIWTQQRAWHESNRLHQCFPSSVLEREHNIHAGSLNLKAIETIASPVSG